MNWNPKKEYKVEIMFFTNKYVTILDKEYSENLEEVCVECSTKCCERMYYKCVETGKNFLEFPIYPFAECKIFTESDKNYEIIHVNSYKIMCNAGLHVIAEKFRKKCIEDLNIDLFLESLSKGTETI